MMAPDLRGEILIWTIHLIPAVYLPIGGEHSVTPTLEYQSTIGE